MIYPYDLLTPTCTICCTKELGDGTRFRKNEIIVHQLSPIGLRIPKP